MTESTVSEWDRELDVPVVGSGGAGLVAALSAGKDAGTLVLEKAGTVGGTTAVSGGGLWLPNSRPVVGAAGRQPPEEVKQHIRRVAGARTGSCRSVPTTRRPTG